MEILFIGIGGGLGACCRYFLSKFLSKKHNMNIPLETLIINVTGSFLLGFLTKLIQPHWIILFLQTGFMGGFTTFSTYMIESFNLSKEGSVINSLIYLLSSVILGVLSFSLGYYI